MSDRIPTTEEERTELFNSTKPFAWECDTEFPVSIKESVDELLKLANVCNITGIEMRLVFLGIKADGEKVLFDASSLPMQDLVAPWVMMGLEHNECIAVVMCCEGYSLPDAVAQEWAKGNCSHEKISQHPEHFETLVLSIETQLGTWGGSTKFIGTLPERSVEGPIKLVKADEAHGRFNNLLPCNRDSKTGLVETLLRGALAAREQIVRNKNKDEADSSTN